MLISRFTEYSRCSLFIVHVVASKPKMLSVSSATTKTLRNEWRQTFLVSKLEMHWHFTFWDFSLKLFILGAHSLSISITIKIVFGGKCDKNQIYSVYGIKYFFQQSNLVLVRGTFWNLILLMLDSFIVIRISPAVNICKVWFWKSHSII